MNSHQIDEKDVFNAARRIADAAGRDIYLAQACGDNQTAMQRIRDLLRIHEQEQSFLESPAADLTPTTDQSPIAERPGMVIGPYKLLQQIGEGGMGVVFMAEQTRPVQRTVALKIIKPGMDTRQVIARFEAERQALAMMDHPNIAKVLDAGTTDTGRPYFVMELVKGVAITKYCDEKRLSLRQRLELFMPVCQAVQHAHQKGIIHRDIKPTNVLVAEYDNRAVPKVIDFGVAKATAQKLTERTMFTEFGQVIGTVEYMSPEQAKFNQLDVDTRSDIYSLGVLLYELLAGSPPFEQKRLREAAFDEVLRIIREEEPPKPSARLGTSDTLPSIAANRHTEPARLSKDVQGELDWIVMRSLEKDRQRRYQTANALADDLSLYLSYQPVSACPPSTAYRLKKFIRRNKVAFGAAVLVSSALVAGLAVATWGLVEARHGQSLAQGAQRELTAANDQLASQLGRAEAAEKLASSRADQLSQQLYQLKLPRAVAAFDEGQYSVARENLDDCPTGQRGWEWRWLARQVDLNLPLLSVRGRQMAQFTPDGKQIVVVDAADEKSVKFLNASTGAEERTMAHSQSAIKQLLLDTDGRRLATAPDYGFVALWDVLSGRQLWAVKAHEIRSDGLAFSPDGTRLASASWDGSVKVLSTTDGQELVVVRASQQFRSVRFHPVGSRLLTGRRENGLGVPTPARVWDADSGGMILELKDSWPRCATYSPDGRWVVAGGVDGITRLYDAETGAMLRAMSGHEGAIHGIAFSPDGTQLATAGRDTAVRMWNVATGTTFRTFRGHGASVEFVSFARDGRRLATTDGVGVVNLWDTAAAEHISTFQLVDPGMKLDKQESIQPKMQSLAFSPDSARLAVGDQAGQVHLFEAFSMREECVLAASECLRVAFAPDGRQLATASGDDLIDIWDAQTGELLRRLTDHLGQFDSVAYSPDGTRLVSAGKDLIVRLWDAETGKILHLLKGHKTPQDGTIADVAFRPDGTQLASVALAGLKLWNVQTGTLKQTLTAGADIQCVAYSPDSKRIVAGGRDGLLRAWNANTGDKLGGFSAGHSKAVRGVAFSPDGSRIVSCDDAGMVCLWNADSGILLLNLREPDGSVLYDVAFSPDGETIAAVGDGAVQLWELDPDSDGNVLRRLSQSSSVAVEASVLEHGLSPEAIAAIRSDITLPDDVKQSAIRLAEERMWAAQAIEREKGERLRDICRRRFQFYSQATTADEVTPESLNSYAWELATLDEQITAELVREFPNFALTTVTLAKRAAELEPSNGNILNTLGVAYYRLADFQSAIDAFQKSLELQNDNAFDFFFLAMAHWRLDHKDEARKWYDRAVEWMDKNQPKNEDLLRFRAGAAELLGVTEAKPSSDYEPDDEPPPNSADSTPEQPPATNN